MKEVESTMLYLKRMVLVNAGYRDNIDLRVYDQVIRNCVRDVLPQAAVVVYKNYYEVQTKKEMTPTEARLIGRKMGKTQIAKFIVEHYYSGGYDGRSGKLFKELK